MCHCREELMREVLTLSNLSCSDDNTMEATFTSQAMPCHAKAKAYAQASKQANINVNTVTSDLL